MIVSATNLGDVHKKQSLARYIINGFIMGLGELLPGVGTQTVAILLGIYDETMSAGYRFADFGGILIVFLGSLILFFILIEYRSGFIGHRLNPLTMFFAGFFCSVAAVLPGISLTFVMLVVGVYQYIITTSQKIMTLHFTPMEVLNILM